MQNVPRELSGKRKENHNAFIELLLLLLQIYYWKAQSSSNRNRRHIEKKILTFQGSKTHGMLPGLEPFSHYTLNVRVVNGKGEGPASPDRAFHTPEGGMGRVCLQDPRSLGHLSSGEACMTEGPPDKEHLEAKRDFPIDEHSAHKGGQGSAHRWPDGMWKSSECRNPLSPQLKILLYT